MPPPPSCHNNPPQGTKYIVDGILFKFSFPADDSPYLRSYECANKAAGHDLRGSISIFHAIEDENNEAGEDVNLNCNLMAIIDCLGERQTLIKWEVVPGGNLTRVLTHGHPRKPRGPPNPPRTPALDELN